MSDPEHESSASTDSGSALQLQDITRRFTSGDQTLTVLDGLSLRLNSGESLAITGPSGSGKSTLLQIIGTLDRPDEGSLMIAGQDPFSLSESDLATFRGQAIGFIFQDYHLLPQLSVVENVLIPTLALGNVTEAQRERAESLIEAVGLADRMGHRPGQLSGGQKERVAIARSLIMEPTVMLADEPTGNLDRRTADEVTELLLKMQTQANAVMIVVTHSDELSKAMGKRHELQDGKLV
ncbi:MAG: ABC transporter ATP-binding protein [Planctomycetota bacterium]